MKPKMTQHLSLPRCPHCQTANPTLPFIHQYNATPLKSLLHAMRPDAPLRWMIYACSSCGGIVAAGAVTSISISPQMLGQIDAQWLIPEIQGVASTDIPTKAASYLNQARETISSPSASILMSNSAVDAMLKARKYTQGSLYSRIEQAQKDHLLTEHMAEWAHEIRLDANDERHVDEQTPMPGGDDAKRCLEFAETLADLLFVLPARVTRGRLPPAGSTKP